MTKKKQKEGLASGFSGQMSPVEAVEQKGHKETLSGGIAKGS